MLHDGCLTQRRAAAGSTIRLPSQEYPPSEDPTGSVDEPNKLVDRLAQRQLERLPVRRRACKTEHVTDGLAELLVADAAAWRSWLGAHHQDLEGIWLILAKKGTVEPTSLSYEEALAVALCHGWIDGQIRRRDERTYRQRFTPRRPRSSWSKSNVARVERLLSDGLMHSAGIAAVEQAKADGRWDAQDVARDVDSQWSRSALAV